MIFEELNFLAKHSFKTISDVREYKQNLENKLPELKGKRELLWKNHKSADTNKKDEIQKDINALTEEIDKLQAQKNACNRIIARYEEIKIDFQKELESKQKTQELILSGKRKRLEFKYM